MEADCGCEVAHKKDLINFYYMGFADNGKNEVEHAKFCKHCEKQYEKMGIVLHNLREKKDWLNGKKAYPPW